MTVQVADRLSQLYVGNGINTRFDFTFRVFDQEDETGVAVRIKIGNDFEFLDESKYAVTINQDNLGGYVTFTEAPDNKTFFYIAGKTPVDQLLDITNYDNFYPDAIERALDKLTAILQEWKHLVDFETQARILADLQYDQLSILRDQELKAYIDGIASTIYGQPVVGVPSHHVSYGSITQKELNDGIETVDELRAINNPSHNMRVHVKRYSLSSKFVGGVNYIWDSTSDDVDNGFETIASNSTSEGRWKAVFENNIINAWSVGYVGDGVTSNHLVHEKVSDFLNKSNESWKLIFSNGTFLFNHKHNRFWLVPNVNYRIKGTATIKGGIAFDDDIVWFGSQIDTSKPLANTSITGCGTFDMSDTGMMSSAYKVRVMFYMLNPINLLVDGLKFTGGDFSQVFVTGETGYTSDGVLIKNCRFDIPVSANPASKNDDHTTIYTQATNTVVRNNRFYSSNIRARCISTAIEFHEKDGVFESNALDDLAVGMYIAPQERTDCSNIRVLNNTCRLSNLFVSFWANSGEDRLIDDIVISGNKVKQNLYPDAATLAAHGLVVKTEGLRFLSFIHESGFAATNKFVSNGIYVSGNTFIHSLTGTNDQCQLLYLFCNPPENINFSNNTLKVNAFINSSGLVTGGLESITIAENSIDSRYLSTTVAPFSLKISSMHKCYFDMSDIEYYLPDAKNIPIYSFIDINIPFTLNTIIEGKKSWNRYGRSTLPNGIHSPANANTLGVVLQVDLIVPISTDKTVMMYTDTSAYNDFAKAELLFTGQHMDDTFIIPETFRKRHGDGSAFVALGYTNPPNNSEKRLSSYFYIS